MSKYIKRAESPRCRYCKMDLDILFIYCPWCGERVKEEGLFKPLALSAFVKGAQDRKSLYIERLNFLEDRLEQLEEEINKSFPEKALQKKL